jgi:cAMP phosphodiesterase
MPITLADSLKRIFTDTRPCRRQCCGWILYRQTPQNFTKAEKKSILLKWSMPLPAADNEPVYGYVVYRFQVNENLILATRATSCIFSTTPSPFTWTRMYCPAKPIFTW